MTHAADSLNDRLLGAHAVRDISALPGLYKTAAKRAEHFGDIHRACFFLTQAWIYALDAGSPMADELKERLVICGRDQR